MSTITQTRQVWIDVNGRVVCLAHANVYLAAAINDYPESQAHDTPLTNWMRFDEVEGVHCDECPVAV